MTLRLRRGTDLERQSITFQEGELVYITDTKDLYAGDGTTVGGIKVSNIGSPSSLTQNLNLNGYSIQGSGTISATSFVGDGSGLTGIDIGVQSGQEYDIDIRGTVRSFDSTVIVDPITNTIYGNFYGDGSNLTNVPGTIVPSGDYTINILGYVKSFDDEVIVDPSTKNIYGNFYGDGSNLTNIPSIIPGNDYTINILGYVKSFDDEIIVDPSTKTLYGDFIGSHLGSLRANDSTLLVDADTNAFFGTFVGDGSSLSGISLSQLNEVGITSPQYGDLLIYDGTNWSNFSGLLPGDYYINVVGSVFNNDSSLIIDGVTGIIYTDNIQHSGEDTTLQHTVDGNRTVFRLNTIDEISRIVITRSSDSLVDNSMVYGRLDFEKNDTNGRLTTASIGADNLGLFFTSNSLGIGVDESEYVVFSSTNDFGVGTFSPAEKLDVRGNGIFSGTVTAASFKGSIVADDSTTIVDAINNKINIDTLEVTNLVDTPEISSDGAILLTAATRIEVSSSPFKMASFTTGERDLLSAENGDVIYNTTDNKFQGYANSTWVDLH